MVTWLLKRLGGAIVAGVGWKLGSDAYEAVKERLKKHGEKGEEQADDAEGAEATSAAAGSRPGVPDQRS